MHISFSFHGFSVSMSHGDGTSSFSVCQTFKGDHEGTSVSVCLSHSEFKDSLNLRPYDEVRYE